MSLRQLESSPSSKSLENIDEHLFPQLGEVLWSWRLCTECLDSKKCVTNTCPSRRIAKLGRYFQFYCAVVSNYVDSFLPDGRIFNTHEGLWHAIRALKSDPELTRAEFFQLLSSSCSMVLTCPNPDDFAQAAKLVVTLLTMVDSPEPHSSSHKLERGGYRINWRDEVPFSKYLQDLFPTGNHPVLSYPDNDLLLDMKSDLKARKLKKHLGITFRATHDIKNHLRLYRRQNVVEIYHYTSFMKEHLRLTKESGDWSNPSSSIKVGALPRQLVLEVLDTLQMILFPLSDPKSKKLLRSLVLDCSLDRDILHFEFSSIRRVGEENISYIFLADRLSELYNELQNPRPRGWFDRRMERRSGARHMMMATLIGVIFAVLLGIVSLSVTSYQTWIAYQAWQHPVRPPGD